MKKLLKFTVGAMILSIGIIHAQESVVIISSDATLPKGLIGVRIMPSVSSFNVKSSDGVTQADFTLGFGVGGVVGFNFNKHVSALLEVQYNRLTQKYEDQELDRRVDIDYVNIPLLFSLNTNRMGPVNLNVSIGPQLGINVGSQLTTIGTSSEGTDFRAILAVKQNDFGFAYGFGLDFGLNQSRTKRLDIGFRGVQGLVNISDDSRTTESDSYYILEKSYIKTYCIYAGVTFLIF